MHSITTEHFALAALYEFDEVYDTPGVDIGTAHHDEDGYRDADLDWQPFTGDEAKWGREAADALIRQAGFVRTGEWGYDPNQPSNHRYLSCEIEPAA